MMKYEIFKEVVAEQFLSQMPDDFAKHTVSISSVTEINRVEDRLELIPPEGKGMESIPAISLNKMYEAYKQDGNLQNILAIGAFNLVAAYKIAPQNVDRKVIENVRDRVIMMLINTEQNKELLKTVPHREFNDLSVVYRLVSSVDEICVESAIIKNEVAEFLGMNEQDLFVAAVENTRRLLPPIVMSIDNVFKQMFMQDGMPEQLADIFVEELTEGKLTQENMMYLLTNERDVFGAVSMLYENELHTLAEKVGTDLYILPASIHEVMAVSVNVGDPYELAKWVADINMSDIKLEERLSNQVYHYDKDLRKLSLATDTPNKRLDGIVAEPPMVYETKQSR